jgi:hypothetical protein
MSMPDPAGAARSPHRRLDRKLDTITAGGYTPGDFVLADAKDADMAFGLTSAGRAGQAGRSGRPGPAATARAASSSTTCGPWSRRANSTSC